MIRLVVAAVCLLCVPRLAHPCAGGSVTVQNASVSQDAQRIIVAHVADKTEVIVQINVPDYSEDFGVLLPVPGEPVLDETPIDVSALDDLDERTQVAIVVQEESGGGVGCGAAPGGPSENVRVGQQATIGPLDAVVLSADTSDALNTWLTDNSFVIAGANQTVVDKYVGPSKYFIALKRTKGATTDPVSLGVHFTLDGKQLGLPLPIANLGGGDTATFTIFAAGNALLTAQGDYVPLTLDDLSKDDLVNKTYGEALSAAVENNGGRAFVLEGAYFREQLPVDVSLQPILGQYNVLTRMSSVMAPGMLTSELVLDYGATDAPPATVTIDLGGDEDQGCSSRQQSMALLLLAFLLLVMQSRRSGCKRSRK